MSAQMALPEITPVISRSRQFDEKTRDTDQFRGQWAERRLLAHVDSFRIAETVQVEFVGGARFSGTGCRRVQICGVAAETAKPGSDRERLYRSQWPANQSSPVEEWRHPCPGS